jgi:hypothetical protein
MRYLNIVSVIIVSIGYIHNVASAPLIFNNVQDFEGHSFEHISFDPQDERTPATIVAKFDNVSSFTLSGGQAAIQHVSYTTFGGNGTDGGAVSGEYRIDWGYYGTSTVTVVFETPVDAAGAFFGGDGGATADVIVTLEDGSTFTATRASAGLAVVPNGSSSCKAINGFVGVDSNGGSQITRVTFKENRDAASLDSIFFGTAKGGSHGQGPTLFGETPACASNGVTLPQPVIAISGCTDSNATNYNPDATVDDGSCESQQTTGDCQHASYNPKDRTLTIPVIEFPAIDVWNKQPTGEVEVWKGTLKQKYKTTDRFRVLYKTLAPITDDSSSSCPATYSLETGMLSIHYIDVPTVITVGGREFEGEGVEVYKATLSWEPQEKVFVVKEVEKRP